MSKILTLVLAGAAFAVAGYLVLFRRPIPNPSDTRGLHRSFLIAVTLFASLFITWGCRQEKETYRAGCYWGEPTPEEARRFEEEEKRLKKLQKETIETLRGVWVTLDQSRGREFDISADQADYQNAVPGRVVEVLKTAFAELSYHRHRVKSKVTCYKLTPLGIKTKLWRERILLQLQTLAKARREGVLDVGTVTRALASMEMDLERLHWARKLTTEEIQASLQGKELEPPSKPSDSASEAARLIEEFESASPPRKPGS